MNKVIWVKSSDKTLAELGFAPLEVAVSRKLKGAFTMATSYSVPEGHTPDVLSLLAAYEVPHELDGTL
jgi:hypothetical protein